MERKERSMDEADQAAGLTETAAPTPTAQVWAQARAAYLAGSAAAVVAAKFGVSERALRRRAGREGWTRSAWALQTARAAALSQVAEGPDPSAGVSLPAIAQGGPLAMTGEADATGAVRWTRPAEAWALADRLVEAERLRRREDAVLQATRPPALVHPGVMARRALAHAAEAVRRGEGLQAVRLARASVEIARLDAVLEADAEDEPWETAQDAHRRDEVLRHHIRSMALEVAEALIEGRPLPPGYEDLRLAQGRAGSHDKARAGS